VLHVQVAMEAVKAGADGQEAEDPLSRCLGDLHRCWHDLSNQTEALRAENCQLKVQLQHLLAEGHALTSDRGLGLGPKDVGSQEDRAEVLPDTNPPVLLPGALPDEQEGITSDTCSLQKDGDIADTASTLETPALPPIIRKRKAKPSNKRGMTFGLKESANVSLSAARLGMLTQREILMEELDQRQASMRRMMSAFVPGGSSNFYRKSNVLQRISRHIIFKLLVMVAILANSVYLGFDADLQVQNSFRRVRNRPEEVVPPVADVVFPVIFVVELVIRLGAERWALFEGEEKWWNMFDIVLVLNSGLEAFWPFANFSFLRILRVFRLVRIVRVVRNIKSLKSLRTMVFALINSFVSLMWAFVMICLIIFVFSILFCNGVAAHYNVVADELNGAEITEVDLQAMKHFGSLWATCVSLFCAVTGGNDWMLYGEILRTLRNDENDITGELYFLVFGFYVAFCMVGLLNVVTGIFVDSAVSTRTEDEVVDAFTDQMQARCREVKRIFSEADKDGKGSLTFEQLQEHLSNPWVEAYFHGLEIDPNEAAIIFTLMDVDHDGTVSADEFIKGTMKLKGSAKSVDMLLLMFDQVRFTTKFNFLCSFIEDELRSIKASLGPGLDQNPKMFKAPQGIAKSSVECMEFPSEDGEG